MEDWVTIKNLKAKNPKISLREIGRLLGISHNTVKSALNKEDLPGYKRCTKISEKLQPFEEVIFEMANVKKYRGSRIFEEIKSKGYTGGKTIFYEQLGRIRLKEQKFFTPYETSPGEQSQFDWSPYTVEINGELIKVIIFSYINAFSRYQILEVSVSETQGAVFEALERSLIESGGSPERLQTDNARVFVQNSSKNNFQWNNRYLHFCGHYGFEPSRSLPGHPWSKGKVERPFQYIEDHFIAGGSFQSFEDLCIKLKDFQERMNKRVHSTIKTPPVEMFEKEKASLIELPKTKYVGIKEEIRKVSFDCLISYKGSRYSVPWTFAGKHIWIRISKGFYLEAYSQANKLVARHKIALNKSSVVIQQDHYRGNNTRSGNFQRLKKVFLESFPEHGLFIEKLKAQKRINAKHHLFQIVELSKLYLAEDFRNAIKTALRYNVFNASFIGGYLEKNFKQFFELNNKNNLRSYNSQNIKRDLKEYQLTMEEIWK